MSNTQDVLDDIRMERKRQNSKWGEQNHPDGTFVREAQEMSPWSFHAHTQQERTDRYMRQGTVTWSDILAEEVAEAFAETEHTKLREELIQVAAVAVSWVEALDRRQL